MRLSLSAVVPFISYWFECQYVSSCIDWPVGVQATAFVRCLISLPYDLIVVAALETSLLYFLFEERSLCGSFSETFSEI